MDGKLKASLLLVAMFALGNVSGIAWQSYRSQHLLLHPVYAGHRLKKLKSELHLTVNQEQAMKRIFERAHERAKQINEEVSWDLADIHQDSVNAIREVLTPEQNQKFEKLHLKAHKAGDATTQSPATAPAPEAAPNADNNGTDS